MKLFWEDQKNIYNLAYIVFYLHQNLQLLMMIYVTMKKTGTGSIILPSRRRFRDYRSYIWAYRGFN